MLGYRGMKANRSRATLDIWRWNLVVTREALREESDMAAGDILKQSGDERPNLRPRVLQAAIGCKRLYRAHFCLARLADEETQAVVVTQLVAFRASKIIPSHRKSSRWWQPTPQSTVRGSTVLVRDATASYQFAGCGRAWCPVAWRSHPILLLFLSATPHHPYGRTCDISEAALEFLGRHAATPTLLRYI